MFFPALLALCDDGLVIDYGLGLVVRYLLGAWSSQFAGHVVSSMEGTVCRTFDLYPIDIFW